MKRSLLICTIILLGCMLSLDVAAQTVKIKREAMSAQRVKGLSYTGIANPISSGLRVVGKGTRVYLSADTTGTVSSFEWTFVEKPSGSTAVIDSANKKFATFTADAAGRYIVQVTGNGTLNHKDTLYAQTYMGVGGSSGLYCNTCHSSNYTKWQNTRHAKIFKDGVTGKLEVEAGKGAYATGCIKCHTTGWDPKVDNGNYGNLVAKTGYDTTWYKGLEFRAGDYWTTTGDTKAWDLLSSTTPGAVPMATIGCESCHGPGKEHMGDKVKTAKSLDAGVCNQCHDSMTKHRIGYDAELSAHSQWHEGSHTARVGCYPCHSGSAFVKWVNIGKAYVNTTTGKDASGKVIWDATDGNVPVTCSVCHDPHGNDNPNQLRTVDADSLKNGFKINTGGRGQLCMNCHSSRYVQKVTDKAPLYGFSDRFNPHGSPQTDMFFGQNAYEYGKTFANYTTHTTLEDGCVTCHMQARTDVGNTINNHSMSMVVVDSKGVETDLVGTCKTCHGSNITKFDDIKGLDYNGNGKVEGVKTEITSLLDQLKAVLPKDAAGEVVSMKADSAKVYGKKNVVGAVYNYWFVKNDASGGMHNAKYAAALLQNALAGITGVEFKNNQMPKNYSLGQNYPNPFNPTTQIEFSVPTASRVKLNIYNAVGQLVATLANGEVVSGNYKVSWNGRDMNGTVVSSGVYLYRLEVAGINGNDFALTKKMVFAK